jgi:hypothetical protein
VLSHLPDKEWADDFARVLSQGPFPKKLTSALLGALHKPHAYSGQLADLLLSRELQQSILLSKTERLRFRAILAYMLYATWFDDSMAEDGVATSTKSQSRAGLLSALSIFVQRTDWMPPEVEQFVIEAVLLNWDGLEKPFGDILCRGLIPYINPPDSFDPVLSGALRFLEVHLLYGDGSQRMLVMAALTGLLDRWSMVFAFSVWSNREADCTHATITNRITGLTTYVNNLLLRAYLLKHGGDEVLQMVSLDFIESVGDTSRISSVTATSPSLALTCRLLLSPSALAVDRLCHLLSSLRKPCSGLSTSNLKATTKASHIQDRSSELDAFLWNICAILRPCLNPTTDSVIISDISKRMQRVMSLLVEAAGAVSVVHGATFVGYATDFLKEHHRDGLSSDIGQSLEMVNILEEDEVDYVDYLRRRGFWGVSSFLQQFL